MALRMQPERGPALQAEPAPDPRLGHFSSNDLVGRECVLGN